MKKYLLGLFVISWMIVIFLFSHQPAAESDGLSEGFIDTIIHYTQYILPTINLENYLDNYIVRKSAHFFAYFILSLLMIKMIRSKQQNKLANKQLRISERKVINRKQSLRAIGFTLLFCLVFAISDEIHQLFIKGRSGEVWDVIIDTTGAVTGVVMYFFIEKIKRFF